MTTTTTPANLKKYWDFVNRCEVDDPAETRRRCNVAEDVLKGAPIANSDFDEMMMAVTFIYRESYHR